jgi:hypothetical protein
MGSISDRASFSGRQANSAWNDGNQRESDTAPPLQALPSSRVFTGSLPKLKIWSAGICARADYQGRM